MPENSRSRASPSLVSRVTSNSCPEHNKSLQPRRMSTASFTHSESETSSFHPEALKMQCLTEYSHASLFRRVGELSNLKESHSLTYGLHTDRIRINAQRRRRATPSARGERITIFISVQWGLNGKCSSHTSRWSSTWGV